MKKIIEIKTDDTIPKGAVYLTTAVLQNFDEVRHYFAIEDKEEDIGQSKVKYSMVDLLKRIENLEMVISEIERKGEHPHWAPLRSPNFNSHYHNGVICYQDPCIWVQSIKS